MLQSRKPSIYLIGLSLILLAMGLAMSGLVYQAERSLRDDALMINEAGIVRGSIQRLTKLALHSPGASQPDITAQIDDLMAHFISESHFAFSDSDGGTEAVSVMQDHWQRLKQLLQSYSQSQSTATRQQLVVSSEAAWQAALNMVSAVQKHSESKVRRIQELLYFMLFLISLSAAAIVVMLVLYVRRKLEYESARDHLTGLYNRRMFDRIREAEEARSDRYNTPLSLLIIDIDFFKSINDQLGHKTGDRVLVEFANLMAGAIRETDRLFRVGGEEFVILTPGVSAEVALQMAEKLRVKVKSHDFSIERPVTISIGVSQFVNGESSDKLYQRADQALYQAKSTGRDTCCRA